MMECKKKLKIIVLGHFTECCTLQRTPLPSVVTMTLGKEFFFKKKFKLCRETEGTRQRIFFKKNSNFAERQPGGTPQRIIRKKIKHLCQGPDRGHSAKKFLKIKIKNLCRVPAGLALGKATVNGAGAVTVAFSRQSLCRVPPGLSAKPLPSA